MTVYFPSSQKDENNSRNEVGSCQTNLNPFVGLNRKIMLKASGQKTGIIYQVIS